LVRTGEYRELGSYPGRDTARSPRSILVGPNSRVSSVLGTTGVSPAIPLAAQMGPEVKSGGATVFEHYGAKQPPLCDRAPVTLAAQTDGKTRDRADRSRRRYAGPDCSPHFFRRRATIPRRQGGEGGHGIRRGEVFTDTRGCRVVRPGVGAARLRFRMGAGASQSHGVSRRTSGWGKCRAAKRHAGHVRLVDAPAARTKNINSVAGRLVVQRDPIQDRQAGAHWIRSGGRFLFGSRRLERRRNGDQAPPISRAAGKTGPRRVRRCKAIWKRRVAAYHGSGRFRDPCNAAQAGAKAYPPVIASAVRSVTGLAGRFALPAMGGCRTVRRRSTAMSVSSCRVLPNWRRAAGRDAAYLRDLIGIPSGYRGLRPTTGNRCPAWCDSLNSTGAEEFCRGRSVGGPDARPEAAGKTWRSTLYSPNALPSFRYGATFRGSGYRPRSAGKVSPSGTQAGAGGMAKHAIRLQKSR